MHVIVFCPIPNINNALETRKSWVQISYRPEYFSGLIFTVQHCGDHVQIHFWHRHYTEIMYLATRKECCEYTFCFRLIWGKNAFSVANTVLNSIVMLVYFFAFRKLWQSKIKHVKIYLFYSVAWRIVFHVIILNVFRVSSFPKKRRNGKWWVWFDFRNKSCHTKTKDTVVDNEKGLNFSLFIDVTKANQINKRKLMLCARFSYHYLVDSSLIKLCVTEVTRSKLANCMKMNNGSNFSYITHRLIIGHWPNPPNLSPMCTVY